jgi:hypothetical protein
MLEPNNNRDKVRGTVGLYDAELHNFFPPKLFRKIKSTVVAVKIFI